MKLIEGETVLDRSFGLTLTTYRITTESQFDLAVIMLEDLVFCGAVYTEQILWLLGAILGTIGAIAMGIGAASEHQLGGAAFGSGLLAFIFFVVYFGTRKALRLASAAGSITVNIPGRHMEKTTEFITALLSAKDQRYQKSARAEGRRETGAA